MTKVLMVNLAFWAAAIMFPIVIQLVPTGTGQTPKFFEFFVPLFQIMLACGATYLVKTAIEKSPAS